MPKGSCLEEARDKAVILNRCDEFGLANQWELIPSTNGYYSIRNSATHHVLDIAGETNAQGALLIASTQGKQQSALWLLRPAYLRGVDNALLEKQEALRVSQNTPWWKDNGVPQDVLSIFKDHGLNTISPATIVRSAVCRS